MIVNIFLDNNKKKILLDTFKKKGDIILSNKFRYLLVISYFMCMNLCDSTTIFNNSKGLFVETAGGFYVEEFVGLNPTIVRNQNSTRDLEYMSFEDVIFPQKTPTLT